MANDIFKYILRFTIQPGYFEEERLRNLVTFCKQAKIDDVTFFVDCEELNNGHIDRAALKPWLELISRAKDRLLPLGITTSINPWATLLHGDRGRRLQPGQNFTLMVDPTGQQAAAQACPLSPDWRKYIADIYAQCAAVKPDLIWVEDDFRFHNHPPLKWGGCFCDRHMEEYSKRAGKSLARQEFLDGILKQGEPHPFRKIWLDCCRETMVENAKIIGHAVHAVSENTKMGLMSSNPTAHCAEARDWHSILRGLAGGTVPVNRPAHMTYSEVTPQKFLWNFSAVACFTRALVPLETEIYPELDNGPFSRFAKSHAGTRLELETSLFLGSDGITLSLFDMIGGGVNLAENYQKLLALSKPFLNRVKKIGLEYQNQEGVDVLVCPDSAYSIHTTPGAGMDGLYPQETFWAGLLNSYGIAWKYNLEKTHLNKTVAVSGQYFRNLAEPEIKALFRDNHVIMDGEAAYTLFDMGLGQMASIDFTAWHDIGSGYQTYEEISAGSTPAGVTGARMTAQMGAGDYLEVTYGSGVQIKSLVKDYLGKTAGPGVALIGRRHLIYPYGRFKGRVEGHLNPYRREMLRRILKGIKNDTVTIQVEEYPYIAVGAFKTKEGHALVITNFSNDPAPILRVYVPSYTVNKITVLSRKGYMKDVATYSENERTVSIPNGISGMETILVLLKS